MSPTTDRERTPSNEDSGSSTDFQSGATQKWVVPSIDLRRAVETRVESETLTEPTHTEAVLMSTCPNPDP